LKRKLADHKLEEKEGSTRNVRRRRADCYEKSREQQSRKASYAAAKKVKTFCSDCDKFFCFECFNNKHYAME
jgi:ribosomal protein S21